MINPLAARAGMLLGPYVPGLATAHDIFMALGNFRFSLREAAYDAFRRDTRWRWISQPRLGRAPAKQYVGPGEDVITLKGTVYPHYRGGWKQLRTMRNLAGLGQPQLMVDGLGFVHGYWCITSLLESDDVIWHNGAPLKQQFTMTLEFYGEDVPSNLIQGAGNHGR